MRNFFGGDPHFNNVVLQLPLRSHLRDESKAPQVTTAVGDTKIVNNAAYFDNVGDSLTVPNNWRFEFGASDYTIECWINVSSWGSSGEWAGIVTCSDGYTNNVSFLFILTNDSGTPKIAHRISNDGVNSANVVEAAHGLSVNTWAHVAVARSGGTTFLFVNGRMLASGASVDIYNNADTVPLRISSWQYNSMVDPTGVFYGYIRDVRITKGIARYTSNFTPPAFLPTHGVAALNRRVSIALSEVKSPPLLARRPAPSGGDPYFNNVVLQLPLRSNFVDVSKFSRTVTAYNQVTIAEGGAYFDGTTDYLSIPNSSSFNPNGTITIECQVFVVDLTSFRRVLTIDGASGSHVGHPLTIETDGGVSFIITKDSNNLQYTSIITTSGVVPLYQWTHIAVVKQGVNGRIYINGVDRTSTGVFSEEAEPNTVGSTLKVGVYHDNSGGFYGLIRDLRITKGVARYTSNFVSPTLSTRSLYNLPTHGVPNLTTLIPTYMKSESRRPTVLACRSEQSGDPYYHLVSLHLPFQDSTRDVSPARCTVTQTGGGVWSGPQYLPPTLRPVARASYFYDPATHYLTVTTSALGLSNWTIEFWSRSPNFGSGTGLSMDMRSSDNDTNGVALYFRSTGKFALGGGNPFVATESTQSWTTATWYHIAAVFRSNTIYVYVDGKLQITREWTTEFTRTSWKLGGQWDVSDTHDGYLCDFRVTRGVARYMANFAPPIVLYPTHGVAPPYGLE